MLDFYSERQRLNEIKGSVKTSAEAIGADRLKEECEKLKAQQSDPDFWSNMDKARAVNQKLAAMEKKIEKVETLLKETVNVEETMAIAEEMGEEENRQEVSDLLKKLEKDSEQLFLEALMQGKYDMNNAILTIHAGAGGTEAQDWVSMLYRMYTRYGEREGYKITTLDYQDGEEAGIKSVTFQMDGDNAYGFLKAEKGVHRLVRISPFDANKRRHTSFASVEVMPEIQDDTEIKINPEELRIDTCRSSGAGGQHVNKTESAIRITHLPTGIVVWCQNERSQIQNRETAMRMLISKLTELKEREQMEKEQEIKGELKKIEWGSQIRSYVFCPYTLVKDHRTGYENSNVEGVMDGDLEGFIYEYLKKSV